MLNFSLKRFNNHHLDNIEIRMLQEENVAFITNDDVQKIVKKHTPNQKIGELDIPALERELLSLPTVDSANVFLKLNGELNLDIVQKIPIFRLKKGKEEFYVDEKGVEFPLSSEYSHPCMLVVGKVEKEEYKKVVQLIKKINNDDFSKNFFIGVRKVGNDYILLTSEGNYNVELGSLENINFKIKGFKTFVEKYLIYQDQHKYSKISLKYDNQIVTTLRKI